MVDEKDDQEPVSALTYGGAKLPSAENPPPSYRDRVESLRALSHSRQAVAQSQGRVFFQDNCPMSDCRHTRG